MQPLTISLVSQRVSDSMETQEVHPTRQDKLDKHNSSTCRCDTGMRKSIGGHDKQYKRIANHDPTTPTPHPTAIIVQQPRNDKRQTLENSMITRLRKTNAKPHRSKSPKQNQPRQHPKDEIHTKIRLFQTASHFSIV